MDSFGSGKGFIMAAVGSAVGLGNLFRFPGLAAKYGIWFIIAYVILIFLFGLPLLLCELYFGKKYGGVGVFGRIKKGFSFVGGMGIINCVAVLVCYLFFFALVIKRAVFSLLPTETSAFDPLFLLFAVIVGILSCGSAEKLGKISEIGVFFSVSVITLLALVAGFKNPTALLPLFSVSPRVVLSGGFFEAVCGQVFFSLSLGVGVMIAFGSMLPKNTPLLKSSVTICFFDFFVSLISTAIYLCLSGTEGATADTLSTFSHLLRGFFGERVGRGVGFFFFIGVAMLCLGSVISYIKAIAIHSRSDKKASFFIVFFCGIIGTFFLFDDYSVLGFVDRNILPLTGLITGGFQSVAFSFDSDLKRRPRLSAFFRFLLPLLFAFLLLRKIFI